jgi:predicted O-methyltransferase YrrM
MVRKIISRIMAINALVRKYNDTEPAMEVIYRDLFLRELMEAGIRDTFYPVGASGNHGLLYFIARCVRQLPLQMVVELGAGQSTLLISQLKNAVGGIFEITTIEHDGMWAERLQPQVDHPIVHAPLAEKHVGGRRIQYYEKIAGGPPIDFLIIDGPPAYAAHQHFSRVGSLDLIEDRLAEDFVIVVDDVQRKGEKALVSGIKALLRRRGRDYREGSIRAIKCQSVFAGGRYLEAAFY